MTTHGGNTATTITRRVERSPRTKARVAGAFYLLNIVAGSMALVLGRGGAASGGVINLVADAFYVVVTLLFHGLFRPVNRALSSLAAVFGLAGCAAGALGPLHLARSPIHPLALFGVYCLLIGRLILGSTFLPRAVGVLMAIGGLGWLTFAFPPLARELFPYNLAPGILGEGTLTVWLLVVGLDARRWEEQARGAGMS